MDRLFQIMAGIFVVIVLVAMFPLFTENSATLNSTATNITEYEGLWQTVNFSPLAILVAVPVIILIGIFGIKLWGKKVGGT